MNEEFLRKGNERNERKSADFKPENASLNTENKVAFNKKIGLKIAVTGGIGSGKSTACAFFKEAGLTVFSCDEIYAELLRDAQFCAALEILFPGSTRGGKADKSALFSSAFSSKYGVEKLNAFTHPAIMRELCRRTDEVLSRGETCVIAEIPLLFEGGYDAQFDRVVVIKKSETARIHSVMLRDRCDETAAKKKIERQFDYSRPNEKYPSANKIDFIENGGTIEGLKRKIGNYLKKIDILR